PRLFHHDALRVPDHPKASGSSEGSGDIHNHGGSTCPKATRRWRGTRPGTTQLTTAGSKTDGRSAMSMPRDGVRDLDVAIIGMASRFPGAPDTRAFWRNLRNGVESITVLEDVNSVTCDRVNARAILPDIDRFDAVFFGYGRREAEVLDPQHRL